MSPTGPLASPSSILLATDLGARCDRALARAVMLARHWNARLVAVTVAPSERSTELRRELLPSPAWARPGTPAQDAERELRRDLDDCGAGVEDVEVEVHVESGEVGPALLHAAERHRCDLIVTGIAKGGPLLSSLPGATIRWLSRHAPQPLLVVRGRPRHAYRHIAFASDFSTPAGHALAVAARWFGDTATAGALVHGADVPMLGLVEAGTRREELIADTLDEALEQARTTLDASGLPALLRGNVVPVVEHMEPARLIREYVRSRDADLVSVGSHGRSMLSDVLLGSVAQRILESAHCDVLLVRRPAG
ncbi:universal stress protein [Marilutibacter alkalisoli]|uniref:Universal stress protein n=1 Tax=Marilutibacter alkalisoli TaxID=2591633 RepID=A0A514BUT5_9GAMM|nr:universal stress protein [Lysobacter alkalisoli]QDH71075.1 universal stress protein [Lysobacter alkalisoli]